MRGDPRPSFEGNTELMVKNKWTNYRLHANRTAEIFIYFFFDEKKSEVYCHRNIKIGSGRNNSRGIGAVALI